jgi:hypothetical protein
MGPRAYSFSIIREQSYIIRRFLFTQVPGSNPLRIRTKGIQAIYYQHMNRCFGFEPGSQGFLIIFNLSECYQKTTLNHEPRNVCIYIITPVPGSNPLRIRTKGIQGIYYQQIFQDISAPRTRINLSFALLKPCFQAHSFEYKYVEFKDNFF